MATARPMPPADNQAYILWDEHVAKLAAIREALEAERVAAEVTRLSYGNYMMLVMRDGQPRETPEGPREKLKAGWLADRDDRKAAASALDALLVAP